AGLPDDCFLQTPLDNLAALLAAPTLAGTIVHSLSVYRQAVARALAEREGAILPLISAVDPALLLRRTLLEKTVSIDTTAAGGNASLMTMAS
ncbi:MAG: hypothetical protein AAGF46_07600, partial [Pseudomonadota bacterium]